MEEDGCELRVLVLNSSDKGETNVFVCPKSNFAFHIRLGFPHSPACNSRLLERQKS